MPGRLRIRFRLRRRPLTAGHARDGWRREGLLYERRGAAAVITFNRPQARNAMTFAMYEGLVAHCDESTPTTSPGGRLSGRGRAGVRLGHRHPPVPDFDSGRTGVEYEAASTATSAASTGCASRRSPSSGLPSAPGCRSRRRATCGSAARRAVWPAGGAHAGQLPVDDRLARLVAALGESRAKDIVFTARMVGADEAHAAGLVSAVVPAEEIEAHVFELAERVAGHAPITLRVTKEALRRLREANVPDGADLVAEAYGSEDFRPGASRRSSRSAVTPGPDARRAAPAAHHGGGLAGGAATSSRGSRSNVTRSAGAPGSMPGRPR